MNQSVAHTTKRDLRRALGPAALGTLTEQAARLVILETFVSRLNTSLWRRPWWAVTGQVHA